MLHLIPSPRVFASALALTGAATVVAWGQQEGDEVTAATEMKAPHLQLIEELETEVEDVTARNRELEAKLKSLSSSLRVLAERESVTQTELADLREAQKEALVRLELLSSALDQDGTDLEQQLADAAADYRLVEEQKSKIAHAFLNLSDAVESFMKGAENPDAEARLQVEQAIRSGEEALGLILRNDRLEEKSLSNAQVISINPDYKLVLIDVGEKQGLRVGTPVSFHRKDRTIGDALIIAVRDDFAGAILLELTDPNDQLVVGDSMRIDPQGV